MAERYGVSTGTASDYFRHVLFTVYTAFDGLHPRLIRLPTAEERADMEGLLLGFPKCAFLVDGNKNKSWRPKSNRDQ